MKLRKAASKKLSECAPNALTRDAEAERQAALALVPDLQKTIQALGAS